jgi:hypothetical protein
LHRVFLLFYRGYPRLTAEILSCFTGF